MIFPHLSQKNFKKLIEKANYLARKAGPAPAFVFLKRDVFARKTKIQRFNKRVLMPLAGRIKNKLQVIKIDINSICLYFFFYNNDEFTEIER